MIQVERYHDISCGHRVYGHESKCKNLHGHNYRFHFTIEASKGEKELDSVGRVIDFSVIKQKLCEWLEDIWDHKMLIWKDDPMAKKLEEIDPIGVYIVSFNPTAENMAKYFLEEIAPDELSGTGCTLVKLKIEETRKCSVIYKL